MTGLWTRVNGREGSRQYRRVDNTQRYVVQSGENFENVPVHSACKAETATPDCVKQRRYTPGWDLIQDEVGSHVMAYLVMVHGKCLGVLLNTRTPMKTGVSSCSASGLVGPSFPQTPKFLRGFRHDTWIVRHTTENLSLSLSLSIYIYIYIYIYQCAWQHVWHLSAFYPSYSQETFCGKFWPTSNFIQDFHMPIHYLHKKELLWQIKITV